MLSPKLCDVDPNILRGPHETSDAKIARFAEDMRSGVAFPPIRAVDYGSTIMIIDGHHRAAAARLAGCTVRAMVADGEAFEDLDNEVKSEGKRADDLEFWQ